ncbi:hypothetical protein EI534_11380 [Pseudomonas frederiksbergensis]|nr:hypothetical protein [Pseudomonas frederiksbergensis]
MNALAYLCNEQSAARLETSPAGPLIKQISGHHTATPGKLVDPFFTKWQLGNLEIDRQQYDVATGNSTELSNLKLKTLSALFGVERR